MLHYTWIVSYIAWQARVWKGKKLWFEIMDKGEGGRGSGLIGPTPLRLDLQDALFWRDFCFSYCDVMKRDINSAS